VFGNLAVQASMIPVSGTPSIKTEQTHIQSGRIILEISDTSIEASVDFGRTIESKHWVQSSL
jgi:hypothetical protein